MKKNLLLCLIILIIIRNIMTREEFKAEMAEKKERAEARINSALQMFADMIIDRMEVIEASNWKQGWTDGEAMIGLPQNVTGRVYTGSNAFLCQLHSMKNNYKVPVYLTFPQLKDLGAFPKKGEKSIPIFKWGFSIHNRETGEKATLEEYDSIPKEERDKKYKVIPYLKIFNEWNIDQTNLEEVNKEKYDALLSKFEAKEIKDDNGMYSNAAIDQMLASQSWVCPIEYTQQNPSALYNKSKDVIIVPRKDQFNISDTPEEIYKDGEEYYSSLIHEMAHSTGHESRLNRLSPDGKFGGEEYAKEELVAELTAAMVGSALGFDSRIRDNNTAYLKSWMSALKKEPKFLLSVMSDVNKASAMVIEHIDEERVKLGEKALLDGNLDGEEEREKNEKEMQKIVNDATQEKESFSAFRESRTFQVLKGIIISAEWNTGNPLHNVSNFQDFKKAFASVTDIDKFEPSYPKADEKDLTLLKTQVAAMSQKELLEAGAYMLPYYHYPHKEGRTLEDIRQSFRRIEKIGKANPGNEQIQKRVEQARSIYNRYEQNVMDQYKSYEISEDEMKIPSIPMPRYTYIEGLPQLEARQQIQKEFNSLESYMKAISLKSGEVSVRYNIDNNMLEAWREVDGNSELFTSRKYDRRMDGISNMDDFVFHLANEDAKAANMPLYSENKENKMMLEYIEKRAFVWSRLNNQLKHPSGEILIFDYVKEKDAIDAFVMSGEGKRKVYSMHFGEGGETILQNYNFVKKELLSMKQFQKKEDPREAVAKEWDSLAEKPTVKMESGDVLPVEYNKEKDTLDVLITNGAGKQEVYSTNYDHDRSIKGNLGYVWEELSNMKQYQAKEVKQETSSKTSEDKVLVENSSYAVTYNQQNSTYDLLRKIEKEKVLELIGDINDNDEIKASSDDVQKLAYEDAAQQMAEFAEHEPRFLTMPNREVLDFQYNAESNQIEVGKRISEGMDLQYTFDYDLSSSPEHNLSIVHDDLAGLDEFRMLSVEEIEQREKIALSWRNTDNKLEMPSGDVLTVEYDKEKDTLNVAYTTVDGKPEIYSTKYNHEGSTTKNVRDLWQNFANMKQYQSTKEASPEKENKEKASATQEKKGEVYYYSYAYLQSTDDTQEFDDLQKKGDYKQILQQAQMYDQGDALEQSKTFKNAKKYGNDDILDEDDHYAVVYNNGNGGTYELMRKVTKEEILDDIDRYGLEQDASEDVKKVAYESVAKQFSEIKAQIPAFTMPNNDVLYVQYNQEKNQVEVGHVTNIGLMKEHTFDYDVNQTLDANLEAINESLQENEEYQAIEEDEEEAESLDEDNQVKVPREDSNIETDVAGMAKQFVAEGMSMEEAEQKAKSIVEEQQHQEHYDEEKQKDAEQKQQQKKQEEQAKKEEEKKPVNHAALLFAALGLASEKNGVWMNRAQRQPAEFIHSHTPVTAYNSIMMTLNTDANKYKTNVYTFYKSAAENNLPVKRNEESLKFNWVNWNYQNMMNHDDIITQKKYDTLSDEEKSFYAKHASRVEQHIYNVDQTIMNAKDHEAYGNLVKTKGAPFVKAEERTISVLQQYNDYQKKHPDVVVLEKTGDSYEIYGEKASDVAKILNLEIEKKKMDGKKVDLVSFPSQHLDTYLPKIIRAGNRVSINDNLKEKKVSIPVQDNTAILNKAYSTAKAVADQSGMKYERIMVVQDTKYDKVDDKIVVSGMSEKTADENHATLYKANDIYRAVVAAVGSEERLDRSGRNSFLPEDDAKHEKLVQELAAGVLMTRQGLPAILSKESEKLVPYWQRELTENPKMLGVLERDVNNAVETIDSILAKREVDYKAIRGQMPGKILTENPERFSISSSLAKLPSMETKEMVVVLDKKHKTADVILPAGASLQVNNEVPGMNKKRILTALGKMGVKEVSFYNAGGGLSLHESNDYYKGKEVTVSKLKQYELLTQQTVDLKDKFAPKKEVKITTFEALPDDMGRYAFFIKAENEPSFAVYPNKEHVNQFYSSLKSENRAVVHNALAKKYYELGTKHPDARVDVITPRKVNIGDAKIDRICITAKRNDPKQHIIFATVNGERMHAPVSKAQWNKMWLSEDMSDYKQRLAAVIFEPFIKKEVKNDVNQQASEKKDETVKPDSPAPEKEQEEQVEQTSRKGRGIH